MTSEGGGAAPLLLRAIGLGPGRKRVASSEQPLVSGTKTVAVLRTEASAAQDGLQVVRPVSPPVPSYSIFVATNYCFFLSSSMVVAESGIMVPNLFDILSTSRGGGRRDGIEYSTCVCT